MTKADTLRAALKAAGYSRRQVTVRHDGCSLDVTIRDLAVPKSAIKAIAGSFENVRRCEASGEILGGGNTFLSVEYVRELLDTAARPIADVLAAATANTTVEIAGRKVSKMAPSTGRWDWTVVSFDDVEPRIHCHVNGGETADQLMFAARTLAEGAIEIAAAAQSNAWRATPPASFHVQKDGSLVCKHRDLSCCDACAAAHREILDVVGAHFWMTSQIEHDAMLASMATDAAEDEGTDAHEEVRAPSPEPKTEDWASGLEAR